MVPTEHYPNLRVTACTKNELFEDFELARTILYYQEEVKINALHYDPDENMQNLYEHLDDECHIPKSP